MGRIKKKNRRVTPRAYIRGWRNRRKGEEMAKITRRAARRQSLKHRQDWLIRKHAVKRFRQRFLKNGKNTNPKVKGCGKRMFNEEIKRIMYYHLRRAILFARDNAEDKPAEIYLAKSEYGDIYFITHEMIVFTVYIEEYAKDKLGKGIWQKV